jgi:hypothetical protein
MKGSRKTRLAGVLLVAMMMVFSACSAGSSTSMREPAAAPAEGYADNKADYDYSGEEGISEMPVEAGETDTSGSLNQPPAAPAELGRKIIRDGRVEMETLEFETTVNGLYQLVSDKGGFIESQSVRGGRYNYSSLRSASIVIRIPSASFDEIMNAMDALGTVVQSDSNGTDITDQYADTESRVRNLKIQETRILELIAKAEKLEEIVTLEARLSDLRYQIESYENSLRNYDRLLTFSRISLEIEEVQRVTEVKPVPKTLGERVSQAFDYAWTGLVEWSQDFLVWVVESMFVLILLAIVLVIVLLVIRGSRRRRRKQKEAWQASHPPQGYMPMQGQPQNQPMQGMPIQGQSQGQPMQGQPQGRPVASEWPQQPDPSAMPAGNPQEGPGKGPDGPDKTAGS